MAVPLKFKERTRGATCKNLLGAKTCWEWVRSGSMEDVALSPGGRLGVGDAFSRLHLSVTDFKGGNTESLAEGPALCLPSGNKSVL